jgi:hypothetical protein
VYVAQCLTYWTWEDGHVRRYEDIDASCFVWPYLAIMQHVRFEKQGMERHLVGVCTQSSY